MTRILFFLFGLIFLACSSEDSTTITSIDIKSSDDEHSGLLHIIPGKAVTYLGTKDSEAKANERPQMKATFSYDFYFGKSEVSCKEFLDLIDFENVKDAVKESCKNDSMPVADVTYYDAVLFANARSKKEKQDTAYSYSKASFDSKGHCSGLEGFAFHPEADAYRLPTEAEWTLVAQQNWKKANGWTSENSDYEVHKICTQQSADNEICDLKGNLLEWVNDWLGFFKDTTVSNFAGAPDGGGIGERVLKGGSYRNSASSIQLYHRGDTYTITSATRKEYVGFRLAFGAIPDPSWMDRKGSANQSPVTTLVSSSTMRKLTSSLKTKIAFRNEETGRLNFIDYTSVTPSVKEIADSIDAYHPDFSPNGNYIAFCDVFEGLSSKASLYVYDLSSDEIIKLNVESAAIPRWLVTDEGDTSIVYVSSAEDNKDEQTFYENETWMVPFSNGKFGTPKKLFNGNFHGGISKDLKFAVTGSQYLRAKIGDRDTTWYNEELACNASLSKDEKKRTLFLDFGGTLDSDSSKASYTVHEVLFISDSTGKVIQKIWAPAGYTFDHSEWAVGGNSDESNLIIATLANVGGAHKKIVLINRTSEEITEIVEGNDLWHPALWSKTSSTPSGDFVLNLDSAGIYYSENARFPSYELRTKMETFWDAPDSFNIVAFGSSRTLMGIDAKEMKHFNLLNLGYSGGDMFGIQYLFENYVLNHMHNVKYLLLESVPVLFWRVRDMDWEEIYSLNPGYQYDENHNFWKDGVPEDFLEAVKNGPTFLYKENLPYNEDFLGDSKSWSKAETYANIETMVFAGNIVEENYAIYKEIVQEAKAANIKVIALNFPVNPQYPSTGSYGPFGPSTKVAEEIIDSIKTLDVTFIDEYNWGKNDYTNEMAFDADHLSYKGAKHMANRLDSILQTLE